MKLLSVIEAATEMNLSENTVYGLCKARKLRHERHGIGRGVIRIPEDAITEYRQGVTVKPKETGQGQTRRTAPARLKLRHLDL